jgi:hypothetical protein
MIPWTVLLFLFSFKIQKLGRSKLLDTMIIYIYTWFWVLASSFLKSGQLFKLFCIFCICTYRQFSYGIFGWFLLVPGYGWFARRLLLLMLVRILISKATSFYKVFLYINLPLSVDKWHYLGLERVLSTDRTGLLKRPNNLGFLKTLTYLLTYLLHGAESFLRS